MFMPPEIVHASVFARLPDEFRSMGRKSAWSFGKASSHLHSFLEGPAFDGNGILYVSDIPYGRIFRVSPEGNFALVTEYDGEPNGLKVHRDGRVFIADHRNGILTLDPTSGRIEPFLTRVRREGFKGVNDLTFASNGDLYFTDQGQTGMQDPTGRVWRVSASGAIDCLIDTVPSPNGLVLSPDEKILYVAATRANQIWRLPIHPDGTTSKVGIFLHLQGGLAGPDGITVDSAGNLIVAHCGLGIVWVFSRLGEPLFRINTSEGLSTTNIAFGGKDRRSLFITESDSGTILRCDLPTPGLVPFAEAL